jgi:hypothetical protein
MMAAWWRMWWATKECFDVQVQEGVDGCKEVAVNILCKSSEARCRVVFCEVKVADMQVFYHKAKYFTEEDAISRDRLDRGKSD